MIVSVCYIAECLTFAKPIDIEGLRLQKERHKIANNFIQLLKFK